MNRNHNHRSAYTSRTQRPQFGRFRGNYGNRQSFVPPVHFEDRGFPNDVPNAGYPRRIEPAHHRSFRPRLFYPNVRGEPLNTLGGVNASRFDVPRQGQIDYQRLGDTGCGLPTHAKNTLSIPNTAQDLVQHDHFSDSSQYLNPGAKEPPQHCRSNLQRPEHSKIKTESLQQNVSSPSQGEKWLENWIQSKSVSKSDAIIPAAVQVSTGDLKSVLKRAVVLTHELTVISATLHDKSVESESDIEATLQRASHLREQLREEQDKFAKLHDALESKVVKARKRRARLKRKKKEAYLAALEKEENRKQRHREIDAWQEKISEQIQDVKMENELKEIGDKTLGEVRRKVSEATRALEALSVTSKLRAARKQSLQQTGLYVSKMSDALFEQRHNELVEVMRKQLRTYEKEQRLLQVILDSEKAELKQHEEEERQRTKEEKEEKLEEKIRSRLFGSQDGHSANHPLFPYYQFYDAANVYPQEFLRIRSEWDCYLVREDSALGSCIPQGWVRPTQPSSAAWASAFKPKTEPPQMT